MCNPPNVVNNRPIAYVQSTTIGNQHCNDVVKYNHCDN